MLVFSRKLDEAIVIGDGIEVRVLRIGRDGVRIGVTAPAQVAVHRREVYDAIKAANVAAAGSSETISQLAARLRERSTPPLDAARGAVGTRRVTR